MTTKLEDQTEVLQHRMVALIRALGLHQTDKTLCGQPVSPSEAHALAELAQAHVLGQRELTERLRLQKSTVSRLVAGLLERGWATRSGDERDGRAARLMLTDAGREAAEQLAASRATKFAAVLEAVPPTRRRDVLDALDILTTALEGSNADD